MVDNRRRSGARNGRRRPRRRSAAEQRDWAEIPHDVLSLIFEKLGGIDVLLRAQAVCRPWRQLSLDPQFWRCIDMRYDFERRARMKMEMATRIAADRSGGRVEELYLDYFGSDDLLNYIADRTSGLRCLVLISAYNVSDQGLAEFVGRCPLLEELQITNCSFSEKAYQDVGRARPELKRFRLNTRWYRHPFTDADGTDEDEDEFKFNPNKEVLGIATNMPQLRELQLIGNQMTNKGLHAILDKCIHLESIDIRACLNVNVDTSLLAKLAKIKSVKLPRDSTAGYGFDTGMEGDWFDYDYLSGYSDNEFGFDEMFYYPDSDFSYDEFTIADCIDDLRLS